MRHHKFHLHLNWIIIFLMAAVSILPMLVVGISGYQIASKTIQDEVTSLSQEYVEQQYIRIIQIQQNAYALLVALEEYPTIHNYFENFGNVGYPFAYKLSSDQLQTILAQLNNNSWIESVDLITPDGKVLSSRENVDSVSVSPKYMDYYRENVLQNSKDVFFEGIKRVYTSDTLDSSRLAIIKKVDMAGKANPQEPAMGYIVLNYSIKKIQQDLTSFRFGNSSVLYVSDANNRIMITDDITQIGDKLPKDILANLTGEYGNLTINNNGIPSFMNYLKITSSGWTITQTVPTQVVTDKVNGIMNSLRMVLIVCILASVATVLFATIFMIRPISQIAGAFMDIRGGKFDWKLQYNGSVISEIDELMHGFNAFIKNEDDQQSVKLALHNSEERYKALFENSPVALWEENFSRVIQGLDELGLQGDPLRSYLENHPADVIELISRLDVLDVNRATLQLYGISRKEEVLRDSGQFFRVVSHEQLVDELMAMKARQLEFENTVNNSRKDGKIMQVRVRWSVYPGYEKTMAKVIVNTVDVTQQTESNNVQAAIYRISQAASTNENLQELYHSIHNILGGLMPAKNFYIALYDEKEGMISFPYHVDELDPHPEPRKFGNGWTEYVIRTGEPMLLSPDNVDILEEEEGVRTVGTDSIDWLGVPLKVEDRVIGMVAVQTYTEGVRYTDVEKNILSFVSSQIAMAIERKRNEEKLKYSSTHEPLTGLYNRGYYEEEIRRLSSGRQSPIGSIIIDIDRLKAVNDQYGHSAGDEMLITFARILQSEFRAGDVVARLGGDEFGILLPLANFKTVEKAVSRISKTVDEYNLNNPRIPIFYSVGYCTTEDGKTVLEAANFADSLMYADKAQHRKAREVNLDKSKDY